ncbi:MAG TPA: hypothetical protein PKA53_12980 [Sphingobacterium sp.]|nr:hypothetical protein [Sphingobacterium sp.]
MKTNTGNKKGYAPRAYNPAVVASLAKKFGYTEIYIRRCLRGDADGIMPDEIRKEYKVLDKKMVELLNG